MANANPSRVDIILNLNETSLPIADVACVMLSVGFASGTKLVLVEMTPEDWQKAVLVTAAALIQQNMWSSMSTPLDGEIETIRQLLGHAT